MFFGGPRNALGFPRIPPSGWGEGGLGLSAWAAVRPDPRLSKRQRMQGWMDVPRRPRKHQNLG